MRSALVATKDRVMARRHAASIATETGRCFGRADDDFTPRSVLMLLRQWNKPELQVALQLAGV